MVYAKLDPDIPPFDDWDGMMLLLHRQSHVISRNQARQFLSLKAIQHRLDSGRWRAAHRAVYLAEGGSLTDEQRRWVAVLSTGAALAGLSALAELGLRGYRSDTVDVLLPARQQDGHRSRAGARPDAAGAAPRGCRRGNGGRRRWCPVGSGG